MTVIYLQAAHAPARQGYADQVRISDRRIGDDAQRAHYSYLWQTIYYEKEPLNIPKDTKVNVVAHWDNSSNNPLNPDPTARVRWGDQSWDEMLVPFVGVLVDRDTDPSKVSKKPTKAPVVNAAP